MPVSQGNFSAGPVGLQLVAWVLFRGATGAVVASSGISGVVRNSVGVYTLTFTAARPNTDYVPVATVDGAQNGGWGWETGTNAKAVGSFQVNAYSQGAVAVDPTLMHVAIYA